MKARQFLCIKHETKQIYFQNELKHALNNKCLYTSKNGSVLAYNTYRYIRLHSLFKIPKGGVNTLSKYY